MSVELESVSHSRNVMNEQVQPNAGWSVKPTCAAEVAKLLNFIIRQSFVLFYLFTCALLHLPFKWCRADYFFRQRQRQSAMKNLYIYLFNFIFIRPFFIFNRFASVFLHLTFEWCTRANNFFRQSAIKILSCNYSGNVQRK